ncbi:MAG: hypothetical protein ACLQVD_15065 [Capsulimonadaceae bacterium]
MFGLFGKPGNRLYELSVPITRGAATTLVSDVDSDRVVCYAFAPNEEAARELTLHKIQTSRCVVHAGWQVREVDASKWSSYSKTRWPRSAQTLPNQTDVAGLVKNGGFFFGPPNPRTG